MSFFIPSEKYLIKYKQYITPDGIIRFRRGQVNELMTRLWKPLWESGRKGRQGCTWIVSGVSLGSGKCEFLPCVCIYRRPEKFTLLSGEGCLCERVFVNGGLEFLVRNLGQDNNFFTYWCS